MHESSILWHDQGTTQKYMILLGKQKCLVGMSHKASMKIMVPQPVLSRYIFDFNM